MPLRLPRSAIALLALAAACTSCTLLPTVASANNRLQVGFLDNAYASTNSPQFWADLKAMNVGFMRWDLPWDTVALREPANPRDPADPAYDWSQVDRFVRSAEAHGLRDRVMLTVWRTPRWATAKHVTSSFAVQMPSLPKWRAFVFAVATRYSGTYTPAGQSTPLPRVTAWETWNEPNAGFSLRPQRVRGRAVSPANYVRLLKALEQEVNAAVPFKPTFVAGAMYKQGGPNSLTPLAFMRGMAREMKRQHVGFDVLSMHPYNNVPRLGVRDGVHESRTNPRFIGIGNFETFIRLANRTFGRKYPIWITEFGLPTDEPGKEQYAATRQQQAAYVTKSIAKLRRLPQVERLTWFLIRDMEPRVGAWYTTGLRAADSSPKPSLDAFRVAAGTLHPSTIR